MFWKRNDKNEPTQAGLQRRSVLLGALAVPAAVAVTPALPQVSASPSRINDEMRDWIADQQYPKDCSYTYSDTFVLSKLPKVSRG